MKVRVLGSGAGGGFPQWNCYCHNCEGLRKGNIKTKARTQSSIALSNNQGADWVLINASPDIRQQLLSYPELQPARERRDTSIVGVILVDSQIDHATGLLMLREGKKCDLYCTPSVYEDLTTGFPIVTILESYCTSQYHPISLEQNAAFKIPALPSITFTAVPLVGKAPPYSPHRQHPTLGDNIGLYIQDLESNQSLFYAPGLGKIDESIMQWMQKANCLLLDGTFWDENEMIDQGLSTKKAADMGHIPQSGEKGLLQVLQAFPNTRKILIHINNTNPILNENSSERKTLSTQHIEVAEDGMLIQL